MQRQPHAALDLPGRLPKAEKIKHLLALGKSHSRPLRLLEIGTGSGAIAHYFSRCQDVAFEVETVDVIDQRQVKEGYGFKHVTGVALPFESAFFDVVISNHVLEHVGGSEEQLKHLSEIARVMQAAGVAYLASPNRWQVIEPHYRLAFLSWLPHLLRTPYLKLSRKGRAYDCEPLRMRELEKMIDAAGMRGCNICVAATRYLFTVEKPETAVARWIRKVPDGLLQRLRAWSPTHVYLLRRRG
jgi:ubiquinone/menaquinone biosynthesis C-methylase UbiE